MGYVLRKRNVKEHGHQYCHGNRKSGHKGCMPFFKNDLVECNFAAYRASIFLCDDTSKVIFPTLRDVLRHFLLGGGRVLKTEVAGNTVTNSLTAWPTVDQLSCILKHI